MSKRTISSSAKVSDINMRQVIVRFFRGTAVVLLAGIVFGLWSFHDCAQAADASEMRAIRASDFLDSLGVVTHIIQGKDSPRDVQAGIQYLGIRNIRDDGTTDKRLVRALCSIHAATGVMVDELPLGGDLPDTRAQWEQLATCGALVAAEGPNEPNNFGFVHNGKQCSSNGTFLPCAQFQAALYSMVHSDPKLAGIPVWGMTEVGAEPDNVGLQWLKIPNGSNASMPDGTQYADVANAHNYVQGKGSAGQTIEDNQAFWAESVDRGGACGGCFDVYGEYWGGSGGPGQGTWAKGYPINVLGQNQLPKVTTETGWNITNTPSVTADMQGRLLTDVYLQAYRLGWSKTFIYLMFNKGTGDNGYGTMDAPGEPTRLGEYIHNLTSILADNSSSFSPGSANCSFSQMPSTVYAMLLQKSDGKHEMAVWGEAFASHGRSAITLNLGRSYPVRIYDITKGPTPIDDLGRVSSVQLTIADHPLIVEF